MKVRLLVVGEAPPGLAEAVAEGLSSRFEVADPARARVDPRDVTEPERAQVDALRLLEALPAPREGEVVVALTGLDLFAPSLAYVLGLSPVGGRRGVVSWARLRPEDDPGARSPRLLRRLLIETLHETGHALSLVHCAVPECAMHRSLWPEAVDLKEPSYCPSCAAALAGSRSEAGTRGDPS